MTNNSQLIIFCIIYLLVTHCQCSNIDDLEHELLTSVHSSEFASADGGGHNLRIRRGITKTQSVNHAKHYKPLDGISHKPIKDKHGDTVTAHSAQHYRYLALPLTKKTKIHSKPVKSEHLQPFIDKNGNKVISQHRLPPVNGYLPFKRSKSNSKPVRNEHLQPFIDKNGAKVISQHRLPPVNGYLPFKRSEFNSNLNKTETRTSDSRLKPFKDKHGDVVISNHALPAVPPYKKDRTPSDGKRNLVQFRDSSGKVIASLHDTRNFNSANVTLSKLDDAKRYAEEIKSIRTVKHNIEGNKNKNTLHDIPDKTYENNSKKRIELPRVEEKLEKMIETGKFNDPLSQSNRTHSNKSIPISHGPHVDGNVENKIVEHLSNLTHGKEIEIIPAVKLIHTETIEDKSINFNYNLPEVTKDDEFPINWKKLMHADDVADLVKFKSDKNSTHPSLDDVNKPQKPGENAHTSGVLRTKYDNNGYQRHNVMHSKTKKQKVKEVSQKVKSKHSSSHKRKHHHRKHKRVKSKQKVSTSKSTANHKSKVDILGKSPITFIKKEILSNSKRKKNETNLKEGNNNNIESRKLMNLVKTNSNTEKGSNAEKNKGDEINKREVSDLANLMDDAIEFYDDLDQLNEIEEEPNARISAPKKVQVRNDTAKQLNQSSQKVNKQNNTEVSKNLNPNNKEKSTKNVTPITQSGMMHRNIIQSGMVHRNIIQSDIVKKSDITIPAHKAITFLKKKTEINRVSESNYMSHAAPSIRHLSYDKGESSNGVKKNLTSMYNDENSEDEPNERENYYDDDNEDDSFRRPTDSYNDQTDSSENDGFKKDYVDFTYKDDVYVNDGKTMISKEKPERFEDDVPYSLLMKKTGTDTFETRGNAYANGDRTVRFQHHFRPTTVDKSTLESSNSFDRTSTNASLAATDEENEIYDTLEDPPERGINNRRKEHTHPTIDTMYTDKDINPTSNARDNLKPDIKHSLHDTHITGVSPTLNKNNLQVKDTEAKVHDVAGNREAEYDGDNNTKFKQKKEYDGDNNAKLKQKNEANKIIDVYNKTRFSEKPTKSGTKSMKDILKGPPDDEDALDAKYAGDKKVEEYEELAKVKPTDVRRKDKEKEKPYAQELEKTLADEEKENKEANDKENNKENKEANNKENNKVNKVDENVIKLNSNDSNKTQKINIHLNIVPDEMLLPTANTVTLSKPSNDETKSQHTPDSNVLTMTPDKVASMTPDNKVVSMSPDTFKESLKSVFRDFAKEVKAETQQQQQQQGNMQQNSIYTTGNQDQSINSNVMNSLPNSNQLFANQDRQQNSIYSTDNGKSKDISSTSDQLQLLQNAVQNKQANLFPAGQNSLQTGDNSPQGEQNQIQMLQNLLQNQKSILSAQELLKNNPNFMQVLQNQLESNEDKGNNRQTVPLLTQPNSYDTTGRSISKSNYNINPSGGYLSQFSPTVSESTYSSTSNAGNVDRKEVVNKPLQGKYEPTRNTAMDQFIFSHLPRVSDAMTSSTYRPTEENSQRRQDGTTISSSFNTPCNPMPQCQENQPILQTPAPYVEASRPVLQAPVQVASPQVNSPAPQGVSSGSQIISSDSQLTTAIQQPEPQLQVAPQLPLAPSESLQLQQQVIANPPALKLSSPSSDILLQQPTTQSFPLPSNPCPNPPCGMFPSSSGMQGCLNPPCSINGNNEMQGCVNPPCAMFQGNNGMQGCSNPPCNPPFEFKVHDLKVFAECLCPDGTYHCPCPQTNSPFDQNNMMTQINSPSVQTNPPFEFKVHDLKVFAECLCPDGSYHCPCPQTNSPFDQKNMMMQTQCVDPPCLPSPMQMLQNQITSGSLCLNPPCLPQTDSCNNPPCVPKQKQQRPVVIVKQSPPRPQTLIIRKPAPPPKIRRIIKQAAPKTVYVTPKPQRVRVVQAPAPPQKTIVVQSPTLPPKIVYAPTPRRRVQVVAAPAEEEEEVIYQRAPVKRPPVIVQESPRILLEEPMRPPPIVPPEITEQPAVIGPPSIAPEVPVIAQPIAPIMQRPAPIIQRPAGVTNAIQQPLAPIVQPQPVVRQQSAGAVVPVPPLIQQPPGTIAGQPQPSGTIAGQPQLIDEVPIQPFMSGGFGTAINCRNPLYARSPKCLFDFNKEVKKIKTTNMLKSSDNIEKLVKGLSQRARATGGFVNTALEDKISDYVAEAIVEAKRNHDKKKVAKTKKVQPKYRFSKHSLDETRGFLRHDIIPNDDKTFLRHDIFPKLNDLHFPRTAYMPTDNQMSFNPSTSTSDTTETENMKVSLLQPVKTNLKLNAPLLAPLKTDLRLKTEHNIDKSETGKVMKPLTSSKELWKQYYMHIMSGSPKTSKSKFTKQKHSKTTKKLSKAKPSTKRIYQNNPSKGMKNNNKQIKTTTKRTKITFEEALENLRNELEISDEEMRAKDHNDNAAILNSNKPSVRTFLRKFDKKKPDIELPMKHQFTQIGKHISNRHHTAPSMFNFIAPYFDQPDGMSPDQLNDWRYITKNSEKDNYKQSKKYDNSDVWEHVTKNFKSYIDPSEPFSPKLDQSDGWKHVAKDFKSNFGNVDSPSNENYDMDEAISALKKNSRLRSTLKLDSEDNPGRTIFPVINSEPNSLVHKLSDRAMLMLQDPVKKSTKGHSSPPSIMNDELSQDFDADITSQFSMVKPTKFYEVEYDVSKNNKFASPTMRELKRMEIALNKPNADAIVENIENKINNVITKLSTIPKHEEDNVIANHVIKKTLNFDKKSKTNIRKSTKNLISIDITPDVKKVKKSKSTSKKIHKNVKNKKRSKKKDTRKKKTKKHKSKKTKHKQTEKHKHKHSRHRQKRKID